ncbi:hypothetical protein Back11_52630 [Paenibacillus baekrokdamisoli]|uniref:Flagellar hook-associated protein 2 n=1 Tax=Paenibacillus baekrokdamisoli TaxID=1712516 RepID=A0A3G9JIK5_9BACL|nr:flagellar filament capping protein FliD [Paenibacillus baekrokdamisoli]MBB3069104.1 flagellar hook-associated protein 2 [Paenibacillus baekrokdamisoli]BBH23918.1 hypothetical protein Back11_52630 [Paenibacillus baekrokdamisoli]
MVMRIAGLGSGMDIDSMVTKIMTAERAPLDKLNQTDQKLTWKAQAYRDINVKMSAFRDSLSSLRFGSNWAKTTSTSSDSSKVGVSSTGAATTGTHKIIVTKLAAGASAVSVSAVTQSTSLQGTVDLSAGRAIAAASNNNKFNLSLNGTTKTIAIADGNYASGNGLESAIQSAVDQAFGANQVKVDLSGGTLKLSPLGDTNFLPQLSVSAVNGNTGLTDLGLTAGQSYKLDNTAILSSQASKLGGVNLTGTSFDINGQTFTIGANDTLNSVMARVNNSAAGVNMYYDSITDKISVTSKSTGDTAQINFGSGAFLNTFKLDTAVVKNGNNAIASIDGINGTYASNTITSNGVTYTLNSQTDASGVSINVNQDTDSIYNAISDFVTKYNDLMTSLNTKLNEPIYRSFQPLTDDQKKAMSDTDIKNWEDKAKSGTLYRDSNLQQLRDNMRQIAYSSIGTLPSNTNALFQVGITGQSYTLGDSTNAGKLQIDSSKLKAAIASDPQGVINLFTNQSLTNKTSEQGVFQQLYTSSSTTITNIIKTAGSGSDAYDKISNTLGHQISDINIKILTLQNKLSTKEDNYYKMFSKMDNAISNSNAQVGWLQGMMPK